MNQLKETDRPPAITFGSTVGFVWASLSIPLIFHSVSKSVGNWYPPYLAFSVVVSFVAIFGIWLMKKWGFYTYVAFIILNQIVVLSTDTWSLFSILVPAIVAGITFTHLKKMS
ncbi:hypothetical protein [Emticicia sp. 17c]|uniref:hypothetical protein n=1 Tax=Emticicia sp. 17c TaxID=3127704 RepID=UPI00301CC4E9